MASHNYAPKFWDSLHGVSLTKRALLEYDRRTWFNTAFLWTASLKQSIDRHAPGLASVHLSQEHQELLRIAACADEIDFSILRGYARASIDMLQSMPARFRGTDSLPERKIISYGKDFIQKLIEKGIYPPGARPTVKGPQPANLARVRQMLSRPRIPWSTSADEVDDLAAAVEQMAYDLETRDRIVRQITGTDGESRPYLHAESVCLGRLQPLDEHFELPTPSRYYGARPEDLHPTVHRELEVYIVPSDRPGHPVVPNFFLEAGTSEDEVVAMRVATYLGTLGARAMFRLQNHGHAVPVYDHNVYAMVATVCNGMLTLYATFPRESPGGDEGTEYFTIRLRRYDLCEAEVFVEGVNAYRNAREWACQMRKLLIRKANEVEKSRSELS